MCGRPRKTGYRYHLVLFDQILSTDGRWDPRIGRTTGVAVLATLRLTSCVCPLLIYPLFASAFVQADRARNP